MRLFTYDEGKQKAVMAGELINGVFIKRVGRARHFLRIVSGYAISLDVVSKLHSQCHAIRIIKDGDPFEISYDDFLVHSKSWSHRHGQQKTISLKFFKRCNASK